MSLTDTRIRLITSATLLFASIVLFVGLTFAWFTSNANTAIAPINSGNLNVVLTNLDKNNNGNYVAVINANPQDAESMHASFSVKNNGDLAVSWQLFVKKITFADGSSNDALLNGVSINDKLLKDLKKNGLIAESTSVLTNGSSVDLTLKVSTKNLPADAAGQIRFELCLVATQASSESDSYGNEYDANAKVVGIKTAEDLFEFAQQVNDGNAYAGYTVQLENNIDLKNKAWTPIGQTGHGEFKGIFDGQGYTISNLNINNTDTSANCSSGLFGWLEDHGEGIVVRNLTIEGATVVGHHNVGVIAGYLIGVIENCHVKNATVICTHANDDACGDKAGVIAGIAAETNAVIKNCTAATSTVTAGRDAGQIVGSCIVGKVESCLATSVTVSATGDCPDEKNIRNDLIGRTS